MKDKTQNVYKCSKCGKVVFRPSNKKWVKSYCDEMKLWPDYI